jgi:hypothetical protein
LHIPEGVRTAAVAICLLGACSFSAKPGDPGAPDAGGVSGALDGASLFVGCHVSDPSLRLCLDFEDPALSPFVKDGSSFSHDATTANLAPMTRAGEQAAMFGSTSTASIAATPDFALATLSIEAWMKPDSLATTSWALLDSLHYSLGLNNGNIVCAIGDKVASVPAGAYANQWVHVACTNTDMHLTLYINGDAVACTPGGKVMRGTNDLGIGVGLTGGIDNVRLFAAAISAADVCAHAGRTGCVATCAGGPGGPGPGE